MRAHNTTMAWATRPIIPAITIRQADQQAVSRTSQRMCTVGGRPATKQSGSALQPHSVSYLLIKSGYFLKNLHSSSSTCVFHPTGRGRWFISDSQNFYPVCSQTRQNAPGRPQGWIALWLAYVKTDHKDTGLKVVDWIHLAGSWVRIW
jgi:hypothetical protein